MPLLLLGLFPHHSVLSQDNPDPVRVVFDVSSHILSTRTPEAFLGFNLDWNNATVDPSWAGANLVALDLADPRLRRLASALAPAVLRFVFFRFHQHIIAGEE